MQRCIRHSKLELRGPRNGLNIDPGSSRGVRSAQLLRADSESHGERSFSSVSEGFRGGCP
eukprot:9705498-Alexandrium_andersonii.AAC.1